ncbi:hypothetical protein PO124_01095 [Bacillus licheniformis]|nr:hypothetical protein [Bacillus licheniformis]
MSNHSAGRADDQIQDCARPKGYYQVTINDKVVRSKRLNILRMNKGGAICLRANH